MSGFVRVTEPLLDVLEVLRGGERMADQAIVAAAKRSAPTVYDILDSLETVGWLAADWAPNPGTSAYRPRWYALTDLGLSQARDLLVGYRAA